MYKFKLFIITTIFSVIYTNAQITIFEEDFESYPDFTTTDFGGWTKHDVDGLATWGVGETDFPNEGAPMAGLIFNPSTCNPDVSSAANYSTSTGSKYYTFWTASISGAISDDYLITPMIDLHNVSNPTLTFFAKSLASVYSSTITPEEFEVLISTSGNAVADFTTNLGGVETVQRVNGNWDEFTRDLTPYIGQDIYIAIHYISPDTSYALHFDDFKVEASYTSGISENKVPDFTYYPNPVIDELNIKANQSISNITITNALGQIIISKKVNSLESVVDTSFLKKGIYYVSLETKNSKSSFSFIKK